MLTKYKIKLEKDGLTITQWVEPATTPQAPSSVAEGATLSAALPAVFPQSQKSNASLPGEGGSEAETPFSGGGGPFTSGEGPATIIGPIVFLCCPCHDAKTAKDD
jgi:hypothetical protein